MLNPINRRNNGDVTLHNLNNQPNLVRQMDWIKKLETF